MKKLKALLVVVSFVLVYSVLPIFAVEDQSQNQEQAQEALTTLDDQIFEGELGETGKTKGDKDIFSFIAGKFHSSACDPYGFNKGNYTAHQNGDAITFEATTESPTDGIMQWHGTVNGDTLEGTATWMKEGQAPHEHWFKAKLKS